MDRCPMDLFKEKRITGEDIGSFYGRDAVFFRVGRGVNFGVTGVRFAWTGACLTDGGVQSREKRAGFEAGETDRPGETVRAVAPVTWSGVLYRAVFVAIRLISCPAVFPCDTGGVYPGVVQEQPARTGKARREQTMRTRRNRPAEFRFMRQS